MKFNIIVIFFSFILAVSCSSQKNEEYNVEKYLSSSLKDTLTADIITYIYKRPKGVKAVDRFDLKHRKYYTDLISEFKFDRYFIADDSTHYYFIIRPARNASGHNRGAGGKFKLNHENKIIDFEELFNTPMWPEEEILSKGRVLYDEAIKTGNVHKYIGNKEYMEFPNERCIYDKELKDWKYLY